MGRNTFLSMPLGEILALMYDWHNGVQLRAQNADVDYFRHWIQKYKIHHLLVVGAGTGRIAQPLAGLVEHLVALDMNPFRLARINVHTYQNIQLEVADICRYEPESPFDLVLVPYSTLQLISDGARLQLAIEHLRDATKPDGIVLVDISTSFGNRPEHPWIQVLEAYCDELGETISEWEEATRGGGSFNIRCCYRLRSLDSEVIVGETERWFAHDERSLTMLLEASGLKVSRCDHGYGPNMSTHRRIFHLIHQGRTRTKNA
jgi:SAM-dependent methyltransferase